MNLAEQQAHDRTVEECVRLRALLTEAFPLVKGWFCDTPNPGSGNLIQRIEEALKEHETSRH